MSLPVGHRDLLLCVLAREQQLLADEQLQQAVESWLADADSTLSDVLVRDGLLSADEFGRLRQAADRRAADTCLDPVTSHLRSLPPAVRALLQAGSPSTVRRFDTAPSGRPPLDDAVVAGQLAAGDRFSILHLHAQGGLGVLFQARDQQIDRVVALKQIKPQWADDGESRTRFVLEAKITGRLEHPGIVPIYALGADETGRPYYAMRLIRGESLLQVIQRFHRTLQTAAMDKATRNVQLRKLLVRFIDVCNALEYAHSHGIIHRDVKPANVMLGKFGETLVVDWGLAKVVGADEQSSPTSHMQWTPLNDADATSTRVGMAVGTPAYMSPEQAAGRLEEIGPASDVYSLGATLYQLLTGETPHREEHDLGVLLAQIDQGRLIPAQQQAPWLPRPLAAICQRALAPRPQDRYPSARALADDIDRWMADEPVRAYAERWPERAFRWMRNHRTWMISLAAAQLVAAVAAVVGMLGWNHFHARRLEDQLALESQQEQRKIVLAAAADSAWKSAELELAADRFPAALSLLNAAAKTVAEEPDLAERRERVESRRARVARLVRYYQWTRQAEEFIAFQNDTAARRVLLEALDELEVLEHGDWWAHLPTADLTPRQADVLRWDVYRQLILLTANYAKGAFGNPVGADGAVAARNALAVAQRVQRFRPAAATRWHASSARFRLARGLPLRLGDLDAPENGADAYMLGALATIATQNRVLAAAFTNNPDALLDEARRHLLLASALAPQYYWTHFVLGYCEMIAAGEPAVTPPETSRPFYQNARRAFSQCIAIDPDYWLAFAERCNSYRQEIEARRAAGIAEQSLDGESTSHLREMMLRDLEKVRQLQSGHLAAHWYIAFALYTAGQQEAAIDAMIDALRRNARFDVDSDVRILDPELQRALPEVIQIAETLLEEAPENPRFLLLRAAARLRLEEWDAAAADVAQVLQAPNPPAFAYVVRGTLHLRQRDAEQAERDFLTALETDPSQVSARVGLAQTYEMRGALAKGLAEYNQTLASAATPYQAAAIQLGRARVLVQQGKSGETLEAVQRAREAHPASEVNTIRRLAEEAEDEALVERLDRLVAEPNLADRDAEQPPVYGTLPILDGGFELGLGVHWNNLEAGATAWQNVDGCQSVAEVAADPRRDGLVLHFSNLAAQTTGYGATSQTVPADSQGRYRLSLWVKGEGLGASSGQIVLNDGWETPLVTLPAGTYVWREMTAEFSLPTGKRPIRDGLAPLTVRLVLAGRGQAWLDDLRVEQIDE